ncbi:MAG: 3-dehydroquinate synthase [Methylococcales bacterium]|jgi:3-dehydroquinate synthase|nr:3-dehydroquinate synthase [Methylococcales bacterium]
MTDSTIDYNEQTQCISQNFTINYNYPIFFTQDIFNINNPLLKNIMDCNGEQIVSLMFVIDQNVVDATPQLQADIANYFADLSHVKLLSTPLLIKGGESAKNDPELLQLLYRAVVDLKVDRQTRIIVIGGGAILDFVGYVAATAHRGIKLIRLPTTVLAQNDAGIGVKNGINLLGRKNFLGTFTPPDAVVCDFSFLQTLSERDRRAGMAEAIKVSLIRDAEFFYWLEDHCDALTQFELSAISYSIMHCAKLHGIQIVSGNDPFEKGNARPLDYGHWLAHKLEDLSGYSIRHGEAVAIGMLLDAHYALTINLLDKTTFNRVQNLLQNFGYILWYEDLNLKDEMGRVAVLNGLSEFREHLGGELSITLLTGIGEAIEVHEIDEALMLQSLVWLKKTYETIQ